ncbi:MAG: hypothetical protein Q8858_00175 [Bacteroidota bacterium]|nr:hypothetical protein [Bacteroidota bacterium]
MRLILWLVFTFIVASCANAQIVPSDSMSKDSLSKDALNKNSLSNEKSWKALSSDTSAVDQENILDLQIHSIDEGEENLSLPPGNPFLFKLDQRYAAPSLYDQNLLRNNLFLSSGYNTANILNNNKKQMFGSFYRLYEQSKPTTMQKVLGMMNLSGAAFLAGYHIYKFYIKKKD